MIQLLALAPEDGWAFARSADRILLLRPPYGRRRPSTVDESVVSRAVAVEGFTAESRSFPDWPALFAFLEERFLADRPALPPGLAPESIERILRHAPLSSLESFLDRIERELLPARQWDAAGELLVRFLTAESPGTGSLRSRAADLLVRCQQERSAAGEQRHRLADSAQAPLAAKKYGPRLVDTAEEIRRKGFWSRAAA